MAQEGVEPSQRVEPGTLHLEVDGGQNGFVIDGAVISAGINHVPGRVIAHRNVINLTQVRILFRMPPRASLIVVE